MDVTTCSVIEHFNVIEHIGPGHIPGFVYPFADAFFFQAAEKGLGHGIVPAVTPATHTGLQLVGQAETLPVIAAILTALVGVDDHSVFGLAAPNRHQQGIQRQLLG